MQSIHSTSTLLACSIECDQVSTFARLVDLSFLLMNYTTITADWFARRLVLLKICFKELMTEHCLIWKGGFLVSVHWWLSNHIIGLWSHRVAVIGIYFNDYFQIAVSSLRQKWRIPSCDGMS